MREGKVSRKIKMNLGARAKTETTRHEEDRQLWGR